MMVMEETCEVGFFSDKVVKDFNQRFISVWPWSQRLISYKLRLILIVYGNRLTSSNQRLGSIKFFLVELNLLDTDLSQDAIQF